MRGIIKGAIGLAVFLVLLLLVIVFVVPPLAKQKAVEAIKESTGRDSRIGSLSINPFTLTATVENLQILEGSRPPLLAVSRIRASVSPSSVFRKALILNELTLEKPALNFARYASNRYSFTDIVEVQRKLPKKKEEKKSLFSVNNISLRGGSIDFDDAAVGRKHTIRNLEIAVPFISNIPYRVEKYVQPKISAVVNGTPFNFSGQLKPFSKSMETSVRLVFNRLSLPYYLAYAPVPPPVDVPSGNLSLDAVVSYRVSAREVPDLSVSGIFRLGDLAVNLKNGRPLLKAPSAELKANKLEVLANRYDLGSIRLDGVELYASRDQHGTWMYEHLRSPEPKQEKETEKEPKKKKAQPPLSFRLASAQVQNGALHFVDLFPQGGAVNEVSQFNVGLQNLSTDANTTADYRVSLLLNGETGIDSSGKFSLTPFTLTGKAGIKELNLRRTWPYLAVYLTNPVDGKLDLSSDVSYSNEKGVVATHGQAALRGLGLKYGRGEGMKVGEILVKDVSYEQKANRIAIADVGLANGKTSLSLEPGGKLSVQSLLRQETSAPAGGAKPHAKAPAAREAHGKKSPPFSYRIGNVHARALNFSFTDKTKEELPRFTLNDTSFNFTNIQGPKFEPIGVRFRARLGNRGPIAANGRLVPQPFSYSGNIALKSIALRQFEDYLPDNLNVILAGGDLDVALRTNVALRDGKLTGTFGGTAGVRAFHILDADEEDLLKWESLEVEDVQGTLAPFSIAIREVSLSNVYSKIVVRPDGTLNLQNLVEPAEASPTTVPPSKQAVKAAPPPGKPTPPPATVKNAAVPATPAVPPAGSVAQGGAPRRVRVGTVVVQGGTVAFSDLHLSKPFNSTFYNLGGRVSGLSSESSSVADVDLRGNLENRSPLQITGKINPLRGDLFVDLKMSFRDIEMPAATPYSSTFLGYTIDQGKLFLDLKYLIEKNKLTSENKVFLDQFTFGKKVESKRATSLPVRLAVALLKDRNGEIHLDLPVTGRTDDPQFKVWGVVWQMLKNVVVKAATSPFSLLSSMFGKEQDFKTVTFDPGSSRLAPAESEKLKNLGKALIERPGLMLEVEGYVNKEKDVEGYRHEQLNKKLRTEKFLQMVKKNKELTGASADTVEITKEEYPDLLRAVYLKEKFPKPRTVFGTVKALPPEEMTKLIYANMIVGDHELHALAHDRCASVIGYLAREGKVPQERMFEKSGDIYAAPKEGGARGRVEFAVTAK